MIRFQDISIKRKLTLIIMVASTVALLLVSGAFVTYELITYRQAVTHDLSTLAGIIGDRSNAALSFDDKLDAEETLTALRGNSTSRLRRFTSPVASSRTIRQMRPA